MVRAAIAQMKLEIKRDRALDSVSKRRAAGADLGGQSRRTSDSQLNNAAHPIAADVPLTGVARALGISRATVCRRLQAAKPANVEPPEFTEGMHPPALGGLTVPITRL